MSSNDKSNYLTWTYHPNYECKIVKPWDVEGKSVIHYPQSETIGNDIYGLMIEVFHFYKDVEWCGMFALGNTEFSVASACSNPDLICVISGGRAYFVNTVNPHNYYEISYNGFVEKLYPCQNYGILLIDIFGDVILSDGMKTIWTWRGGDEQCDEVQVLSIFEEKIMLKAYNYRESKYCYKSINIITGSEMT